MLGAVLPGGWAAASEACFRRGKSGLHETRVAGNARRRGVFGLCVRESATESRPLTGCQAFGFGPAARVKGCGKSAPRAPATAAAWQTPPGARPNRGGMQAGSRTGLRVDFGPRPQNRCRPGWSLERTRQRVAKRNGCPFRSGPARDTDREDRTRLTGPLVLAPIAWREVLQHFVAIVQFTWRAG